MPFRNGTATTPYAWRASAKLVGVWPTVLSSAAMAAGLALMYPAAQTTAEAVLPRVVGVIVSLAFGAQAAFVMAPDGELPLELLLACPRPAAWALWERLLVLAGLQGGLALAATLISVALAPNGGLPPAILGWLAPAAFLGGVAVLATQVTRQGVFGALLATLLWASMLFGGDALLARWPWLWPLHLFLQPGQAPLAIYATNRAGLIATGLALMALALRLLRDEERALGISRRSGPP